MTTKIPDLWPSDIKVTVLSPLMILKTQAAAISQKTQGMIEGLVSVTEANGHLTYQFGLQAPTLELTVSLLTVNHKKGEVYPCFISTTAFGSSGIRPANSQETFIKHLGEALQSEKIRSIIDSLLAQINEGEAQIDEIFGKNGNQSDN